MSRWSRNTVEENVFGVLRPVLIVLLLFVSVFPFYYMVVLSFRPLESVLQDPGSFWVSPGEFNMTTYKDVLASVEDGGQGFLAFIGNSMLVAIGTMVVALLIAIPGA